MKCPQCQFEVNPTLVYCSNCGAPTEADITDVLEDDNRKREETRILQQVRDAKGLLIAALFVLGATIVVRAVLLAPRTYDHTPAFRAPYAVIEDAGLDPPSALPTEPLVIPLPSENETDGDKPR
jgi:hypothetical protein